MTKTLFLRIGQKPGGLTAEGDTRRTRHALLFALVFHLIALYILFPRNKPEIYLPKQREYIKIHSVEFIRSQPKKETKPVKNITKKDDFRPVPLIVEEPPESIEETAESILMIEDLEIDTDLQTDETVQLGPRRVGECDVGPRLLNHVEPIYPVEAVIKGVEARVVIELVISKEGMVIKAEVVKSSGREDFDSAAREAAMKARFLPASYMGVTVDVLLNLNVDFTLE